MKTAKMITTRRAFIRRLGGGVAAMICPSVTPAQTALLRPPRILMVTWRGRTEVEKGFLDFWKSQPVSPEFIWQDAAQSRSRLDEITAEIVRVKPDLVYTWGTPATLGIAGSADSPHSVIGKLIPVVFALVADPVAAKITRTLDNHGRNICGVIHVAPLTAQLQAMRSYCRVQGVGIIYNQLEPNSVANVKAWQRLGSVGNFYVVPENFPLNKNGELLPASNGINAKIVQHIAKSGVNWLYLGPDSHLFTQLDSVATAATAQGLMTFAAVESMLDNSAPVMSGLVSKFYQIGQFAGLKAQQMLSGRTSVPIETLKRFSFIVRMETAKAISAYPPLGLIDYAEFRR